MSIGDIMVRHRPILPQRGSQLGSLGFSFKKLTHALTRPLVASARVVAAPLKVSAAILSKLPGGSGISTALNKGAGLVVGTATSPTTLLKAPAGPTVVTSGGTQSPATIETNTPYNTPGTPAQTTSYQTPGIIAPGMAPTVTLPVDSSGTPYVPQSMAAQDAGPVLAPWYEQPLYLGGIGVAAFIGWKLWKRRH